jgi:hypothetical protein
MRGRGTGGGAAEGRRGACWSFLVGISVCTRTMADEDVQKEERLLDRSTNEAEMKEG